MFRLVSKFLSFRSQPPLISVPIRKLYIKNLYIAHTQGGHPGAIIAETQNDQRHEESYSDYRHRSFEDLTTLIPIYLFNKELMFCKVNQCVLDPTSENQLAEDQEKNTAGSTVLQFNYLITSEIEQKILQQPDFQKINHVNINEKLTIGVIEKSKVIFKGHVICWIFKISGGDKKINYHYSSLLSKVPTGFETDDHILKYQLITSRDRYLKGKEKGSKEFYLFLPFEHTILTINQYIKNLEKCKEQNSPYDLSESACSQAVYSVMTGYLPKKNMSPQRAVHRAIFSILSTKDEVLKVQLRNTVKKSGMATLAYDIGKKPEAGLNYGDEKLNPSFRKS